VQPAATVCRCCGEAAPVAIDGTPEHFVAERTEVEATNRPWTHSFQRWASVLACLTTFAICAGVLALAVVVTPWLDRSWQERSVALAFGWVMVALVVVGVVLKFSPLLRRRARMRSIRVPRSLRQPSGGVFRGKARPLRDRIPRQLSAGDVLAAHLVVCAARVDDVYLRTLRAPDFIVSDEAGERVVVAGELWLESTSTMLHKLGHGLLIKTIGIPCRLAITGAAQEHVVVEGDTVEVCGAEHDEVVPELTSGYRDAPVVRVFRGTCGAPVRVHVSS
jgi:hypothetical protein